MDKEKILSIQNKRDKYAAMSEKSYQEYDDCDKAIEQMNVAISLSQELPFEDNDFLAQANYSLGLFFEDNQEFKSSINHYTKAIELFEKTSNVYDVRYLKSLGAIANFYAHECKYQEASDVFTKVISFIELIPKKNKELNELELDYLSNYASCNEILNRNQDTIVNCSNAIRCLNGKVDKRTLKKVKQHLFLGEFYFLSKGNYEAAAHNFEKALYFGEDIFKNDKENGAVINYYIAKTNFLANIYDKAIDYYKTAKLAFIELKDERAISCAVNIVLINIICKRETYVDEDINKIINYLESNYGAKAKDIIKDINEKLAQCYYDIGNIDKANKYIK